MNESIYQQMIAFYMLTPSHKLPAFPDISTEEHISVGKTIQTMIREGIIHSVRLDHLGHIQVS